MLYVKGLAGGVFQLLTLAALLLIPAGTWQWPRALQFLTAHGLFLLVLIPLMVRFAPASIEARLERPAAKDQPPADRMASALLFTALLGWFVFIPVDVFHLHILSAPTPAVATLGAVVGCVGFGIIVGAMLQNAFAVPIVRIQEERGQVLIERGLYAMVRHPFYTGLLLWCLGLGLWLESYSSVPVLGLVACALVLRMRIEEWTLHEELPGYREYMAKVRWRLIPFLW